MDYVLRKVDNGLWKRFRRKAVLEGRTMRFILCRLVEEYVSGRVTLKF